MEGSDWPSSRKKAWPWSVSPRPSWNSSLTIPDVMEDFIKTKRWFLIMFHREKIQQPLMNVWFLPFRDCWGKLLDSKSTAKHTPWSQCPNYVLIPHNTMVSGALFNIRGKEFTNQTSAVGLLYSTHNCGLTSQIQDFSHDMFFLSPGHLSNKMERTNDHQVIW